MWHAHVLDEGIRAAHAALPNETGGILVGWYRGDVIQVERFVVVPDQTASLMRYTRRHRAASAELEKVILAEGEGTELGYVGEWHAHPTPALASWTDLRSLGRLAADVDDSVAMVLLSRDGADWCTETYVRSGRGRRRLPWRRASKEG
jgi:integrative and conjugative element protein (TIGR02256 family)